MSVASDRADLSGVTVHDEPIAPVSLRLVACLFLLVGEMTAGIAAGTPPTSGSKVSSRGDSPFFSAGLIQIKAAVSDCGYDWVMIVAVRRAKADGATTRSPSPDLQP